MRRGVREFFTKLNPMRTFFKESDEDTLTHVLTNVQVELEAVRPDSAGPAEEEYRLSVALLPLRLRIDQNIVVFLQEFFAASEADRGTEERSNAEEVAAATMPNQQPEGELIVIPILQTLQVSFEHR